MSSSWSLKPASWSRCWSALPQELRSPGPETIRTGCPRTAMASLGTLSRAGKGLSPGAALRALPQYVWIGREVGGGPNNIIVRDVTL